MRFLMAIKATPDYEAGVPPSPALAARMGRLTAEMIQRGVVLASEGLQPSSQGARIRHAAGIRVVLDGPFAEAKEVIGGFAIVQAASLDEAKALAQQVVDVHVDAGVDTVELEIRPLCDLPEFASSRA
ncbi:MAG TPA: YciI family protein [Albitalea sp.]|uniref:YciI family protein n=1 Tax=Piscinibacter sp. TaxID=1903157 RepID=UPI002ED1AC75